MSVPVVSVSALAPGENVPPFANVSGLVVPVPPGHTAGVLEGR
jgi:hypothetical protein